MKEKYDLRKAAKLSVLLISFKISVKFVSLAHKHSKRFMSIVKNETRNSYQSILWCCTFEGFYFLQVGLLHHTNSEFVNSLRKWSPSR